MRHESEHYVNGMWVAPLEFNFIDVVDPATEDVFARVALGGAKDVDRAVAAAKAAFPAFSRTTREQRLDLLKNIVSEYESRRREIAGVLCQEMGAPISIALDGMTSPIDLVSMIEVLEGYQFEEIIGGTKVVREAIGVAGLITPWNWPIDQIMMKVAPALAAGCTMVLKPSEEAPLNAVIWSEIMHSAGVPEGVFNMLQGSGPVVGEAMSGHPDIAIMSFTGSTRAGISVARTAALTVKRVSQELGGKSADILLPDADFGIAVEKGVRRAMLNSGQTCSAPSRMLVPADRHEEVIGLARRVIQGYVVGPGNDPRTDLGPLINKAQFNRVQNLIRAGIDEGARLVCGGLGRPDHLVQGYFARPTIFADVSNDMKIAQEEIFGPVLSILPYRDEDHAVEIANDSMYGLAAYVQSSDLNRARTVAGRLRVGTVHLNHPAANRLVPVGGYKCSGNGRENGRWGLEEYLEIKSIQGFNH